jgi:hypothetical protein
VTPEEVLGVPPGAGPAAAAEAYRRLVREHHPDRWASAPASERARHAERLEEVLVAWSALETSESWPPAGGGQVHHEAGDEAIEVDDLVDPDIDLSDEPFLPVTSNRLPTLIALALVTATVVAFALSVVLAQSALWQAAMAFGLAALVTFILMPFFVMLRSRR